MTWHTTTTLAENIYHISEPFGEVEPRFGVATVNMYLVVGRERAALVDTGMGIGDLPAEVRKITDLPCSVFNTHSHWDHIGANSRFAEIAIHADEAHLLAREPDLKWLQEVLHLPAARAVLPAGFDSSAYRILPRTATHRLQDGDEVDLGGRALRVLHIPGHSPGHVAFFDEISGALFTGDSVYPGPMYACFAGGDPAAFARSLRRLADLEGVTMVCPGHNAVVSEPGWLGKVAEGVAAALSGAIPAHPGDGFIEGQEYRFDTFSIWLP
jgi:glyoxylase-like metal-dependent hydrolase (beta-lactamase superfamily II)